MQEACTAFKFDLSTLPQDIEIVGATLELYRIGSVFGDNNTWDNPTTYEIRTINEPWSDSGNTDAATLFDNWISFSSSCEPEVIASVEYTPAEKGWFTFDVLSAVKTMIEAPESNHGFMLFSNGEVETGNGGSLSKFVCGDGTPTENRPKLTVTYSEATSIGNQKSVTASKQELTFENGSVSIAVFNASGRKLLSRHLTSESEVAHLKNELQMGIYFVQFTNAGRKLAVEKWFIGKWFIGK